jgi:hypothetical protein
MLLKLTVSYRQSISSLLTRPSRTQLNSLVPGQVGFCSTVFISHFFCVPHPLPLPIQDVVLIGSRILLIIDCHILGRQ